MDNNLPIRCHCGTVRGVAREVGDRSGIHVKCYCDDCQAFQHVLGKADDVLDKHGGTEIYQMSQGKLELTAGKEHLACLQLKPDSLLRWYAGCCNTPIGNTMPSAGVPFIGVICDCFEASGHSALGPPKYGVNGRFSIGEPTDVKAHNRASLPMMANILSKMLFWRLRGDHKRSALFGPDGNPVAKPKLLSKDERDAAMQTTASWGRSGW